MLPISLVIPIFNAAPYLKRCLDSVLFQSFEDFECLLVDDGSTDTSFQVCQQYALKDSRFRVLHKENGGEYSARNWGISHAQGEYICYLDADDELMPDYLHSLVDRSEKFPGADLILQGVHKVEGERHSYVLPEGEGLFQIDQNPDSFFRAVSIHRLGFSVSKLFRTSIIRDSRIEYSDQIAVAVDLDFLLRYLRYCKQVYVDNTANYLYHVRPSSITTTIHPFALEYSGLMQLYSSWEWWKIHVPTSSLQEKEGQSVALLVQRSIHSCYLPGIGLKERRKNFAKIPQECIELYYKYVEHHTLFSDAWRRLFYWKMYLLLDVLMLLVFRIVYRSR